jgi:two-component system, cell cycle sensor histidine kinase and response regulator CckA
MERTDFEQWKAKEVARLLALVETERRYYQEMVASLPVALVVLAPDRSVASANRAFRHTFGVRTEDLRRKTIEQVIPSQALVEKIRDVHMHSDAPPYVFVEVDERRFRVAIVPIRNWDDEGEVETLLMLQDVSASAGVPPRAAPAAPVLDLPAITWAAEAGSLGFKSVSGEAVAMLGFPVSHWLSTPQFFADRIHPEDRTSTMAFYQAAIARTGDATAEFRAMSATGAVIWCRETIRVKGDAITGVLTDIGIRKQLEQQLLRAERTDALHTIASRLAHDLNNPLMIITGYAEEMLQTLPAESSMRDDIEQILGATERISGISGQLLGFTRRAAIPPKPVDVAELAAGLKEKIEAGAQATVEVEPASEPVWAMADEAQLAEAILTLASREGGKAGSRIAISCQTEVLTEKMVGATLQPGVYIRLTIRNDGPMDAGMGVFENVLAKGSGQDLARVYATVREWGGDIGFSSDPIRGSASTMYLPFAQPMPKPELVAAPVEVVAQPEPEKSTTILLVEDEAGIRALVRKILAREHYHVLDAGSAEDALSVATAWEGTIDLLLTDVILPGIGGRELAEGMRESLPGLKVLYVSGFTDDEAVRAGEFPPGSKFLQKPFTLSALVGKVREALGAE